MIFYQLKIVMVLQCNEGTSNYIFGCFASASYMLYGQDAARAKILMSTNDSMNYCTLSDYNGMLVVIWSIILFFDRINEKGI